MFQISYDKDTAKTYRPNEHVPMSYDPQQVLQYALKMGAIPEKVTELPLELVNELYPDFESKGLSALLEDFAQQHAEKVAGVEFSEEVTIALRTHLMLSYGATTVVNATPVECVQHIILTWPCHILRPPLVPSGYYHFGGLDDFVTLIELLPTPVRSVLPSHIKSWWNGEQGKRNLNLQRRTMWSTSRSTNTSQYYQPRSNANTYRANG